MSLRLETLHSKTMERSLRTYYGVSALIRINRE